jgi:ABC-2 type transport system permease protein
VSRRRREIVGIAGILGGVGVIYGLQIFFASEAERIAQLDAEGALLRVAEIAGWTPFGAPFAAPFDLAAGHWASFGGRLLVTALTAGALWWWWQRGIRASLVTGVAQNSSAPRYRQRRFIPWFYPASPLGAVAARSLRYWRRDMRYVLGLLMMPIVAVFMIAMGMVNGIPQMALAGPLIVAWGALPVMNDFGYDGPAAWVNITHGVDPRTNLQGRSLAALTVLGPMLIVLAVVTALLSGFPQYLWPLLGGAAGLLLVALGVAAPVSALLPYRVKGPGANMFSSGSGGGVNGFLSAMIGMTGIFLPLLPAIALYVVGLWVPWVMQVAPLVALAIGVGVLFLGWHLGAKVLARREPEVFAVVREWLE